MRAIVFFVQLLLWLLIIRIVVRGLARMVSGRESQRGGARARAPRAIEDLVLDRVCNTYLPRSRALVARVDGRDQPFCSKQCRDRALAAVARAS